MFSPLYQNCQLCPRRCGIDRTKGQRGFCGAGDTPFAGRAALHFWEEPCLSGTRGSGTVFFSHCTLGCLFCQNHALSRDGAGIPLSPSQLAQAYLSLQEQGAHNINLVTPSHYLPDVMESLRLAKADGLTLPIVYNCGGYEALNTLEQLDGLIDIYLPDLKYFSSYLGEQYSAAGDYFDAACLAIEEMIRQTGPCAFDADGILQKGVIVRHLMLPGQLSDTVSLIRYFAAHWKDSAYFSLMSQYTPLGKFPTHPELENKLDPEDYTQAVDYLAFCDVENGYLQGGEAAKESFIPAFNGEGLSNFSEI